MINIQNLTFGYQKNKLVLDRLNLKLEQGKIYGLLGANGTGKSSLLHQICGIIFPQSGTIEVDNHEPAKRSLDFLKSIYILPEEVDTPNISISAYAEIYSPFYENFDFTLFDQLPPTFYQHAHSRNKSQSHLHQYSQ